MANTSTVPTASTATMASASKDTPPASILVTSSLTTVSRPRTASIVSFSSDCSSNGSSGNSSHPKPQQRSTSFHHHTTSCASSTGAAPAAPVAAKATTTGTNTPRPSLGVPLGRSTSFSARRLSRANSGSITLKRPWQFLSIAVHPAADTSSTSPSSSSEDSPSPNPTSRLANLRLSNASSTSNPGGKKDVERGRTLNRTASSLHTDTRKTLSQRERVHCCATAARSTQSHHYWAGLGGHCGGGARSPWPVMGRKNERV